MMRENRSFDLPRSSWELLDNMTQVLDHDSPEETLRILIELGVKAIGITDRQNRTVLMQGGEKQDKKFYCPSCKEEEIRSIFPKSVSCQLGVDDKQLQREEETKKAKEQLKLGD